MTDEQYKEAALRLCALWGRDPHEMVQAPSPRDGNVVYSVYCEEPYWASIVRDLKTRDRRKAKETQIEEVLNSVRSEPVTSNDK